MTVRLFYNFHKIISLLFCLTLLFTPIQIIVAQVTVNSNTNSLEICSVTYEIGGQFYTQSTSGDDSFLTSNSISNPGTDPIVIYKITYDEVSDYDGTCDDPRDVFPERNDVEIIDFSDEIDVDFEPDPDQVRIINNNQTINYKSTTTSTTLEPTYVTELTNATSVPDLRSYWTVDGDALDLAPDEPPTPSNFKFFFSFNFVDEEGDPVIIESDQLILVTERWGNSEIASHAIDTNDDITGTQVRITGETKPDLYSWNTTVTSSEDANDTQEQWLILYEASLHNTGTTDIFGFDVDLSPTYADGSILGFRNPGTLLLNGECWRMLSSSPFQNTTYTDILDPIWTQGITNADTQFGEPNVLTWNTAVADTVGGWVAPSDLNNTVTAGTGFLVGVYADDNFDGTADGFPKELTVEGVENTGTVSPPMNSNASGWTLVGNPFGAPIEFSALTKTNLENVAYVFDRNFGGTSTAPDNNNTGGWRATTTSVGGNTYGNIPNGLIAPFQGFFVQNSSTGSSIEFNEADRRSLSADNFEFFGKDQRNKEDFIQFELSGNDFYNPAWIILSDQGSLDRLQGDALELLPFSEHRALLSTRKGDELFDIAQFPHHPDIQIPLNVDATLPGTYQLKVTDIGIHSGAELIFTDKEKNISLPLDEDFEYEFEFRQAAKVNPEPLSCNAKGSELATKFKPKKAKVTSTEDRFIIQHASAVQNPGGGETPSQVQLNQNYPNPFNPTTQISYSIPQQSDVLLEVYDLTGKLITTLVNESVSSGTHSVTFDAANLSSGVYMYRLQTANRVLSRKLTVIK